MSAPVADRSVDEQQPTFSQQHESVLCSSVVDPSPRAHDPSSTNVDHNNNEQNNQNQQESSPALPRRPSTMGTFYPNTVPSHPHDQSNKRSSKPALKHQSTMAQVISSLPPSKAPVIAPGIQQDATARASGPMGVSSHRALYKSCSAGGEHVRTDKYSTPGILLGILLFPIGLICCYAMREARCKKCQYPIQKDMN